MHALRKPYATCHRCPFATYKTNGSNPNTSLYAAHTHTHTSTDHRHTQSHNLELCVCDFMLTHTYIHTFGRQHNKFVRERGDSPTSQPINTRAKNTYRTHTYTFARVKTVYSCDRGRIHTTHTHTGTLNTKMKFKCSSWRVRAREAHVGSSDLHTRENSRKMFTTAHKECAACEHFPQETGTNTHSHTLTQTRRH